MTGQKKTRGLGKGLDALFGDVELTSASTEGKPGKRPEQKPSDKRNEETPATDGVLYIDINDIMPNQSQPRKHFDEQKLAELGESIRQHGLIQPIVVRKCENGYEIVAGERRWRAARIIGLKEVPCILKSLSDEENMLLAIIENMQREDLNPMEEAEGIRQMIDSYGLTQEEVSLSLGKSRPYITNCLRLLKLTDKVQRLTAEGMISMGHARALVTVEDEGRQIELAEKAAREGLSVRQIESLAGKATSTVRGKRHTSSKSANEKKVEDDLKIVLGTKVRLNRKGEKGKIEIEFFSNEELERLIDLLKSIK